MIQGSNSNRRTIFLFFTTSTVTVGPTQHQNTYPEEKRQGLGVDQSPPSNAQFKKEWSYTPTPTPHT